MPSLHDTEGTGAGAHINGKEIKTRAEAGTRDEGRRGESDTAAPRFLPLQTAGDTSTVGVVTESKR